MLTSSLVVVATILFLIFPQSTAFRFPQELYNLSSNQIFIVDNPSARPPSSSASPAPSLSPTSSAVYSPKVPALFVIGDSTVDCGNNNFLGTFARADRPPYGRDFDTHLPTGRFCNGRIPVDYLGTKNCLWPLLLYCSSFSCSNSKKLLFFFPFQFIFFYFLFQLIFFSYVEIWFSIASWSSLCAKLFWTIWRGHGYASWSQLCICCCWHYIVKWIRIGNDLNPNFLDLWTQILIEIRHIPSIFFLIEIQGQHISFSHQIQLFSDTYQRFVLNLGEESAIGLVSSSVFYISIGINDYIHYYLRNVSSVQNLYLPWGFNQFLASTMRQEIKVPITVPLSLSLFRFTSAIMSLNFMFNSSFLVCNCWKINLLLAILALGTPELVQPEG